MYLVMVVDIIYLRSFFFLKSYKATFTTLLRCSGFFALFYALAALVPESAIFFANVASVCKVMWVYSYMGLMLTNFSPHGHGGEWRVESLHICTLVCAVEAIMHEKYLNVFSLTATAIS
jgi:hypothetical protein